jgi:4a-hydroxytetrahydrobiopterin dehydratase
VVTEMAKPRIAESAKRDGDTLANGGHRPERSATVTSVSPDSDVQPLKGAELSSHLSLVSGWQSDEDRRIVRNFEFPDFRSALAFVVQIGEIAEEQKHHPDILLGWGKVQVTTWTHDIDGLSEDDFILAAKINQITR